MEYKKAATKMLDSQTAADLAIFPQAGSRLSLHALFDYCKTKGGKERLLEIMELSDISLKSILARQETVAFFASQVHRLRFNITEDDVSLIKTYLNDDRPPVGSAGKLNVWAYSNRKFLFDRSTYYSTLSNVKLALKVIAEIRDLIKTAGQASISPHVSPIFKTGYSLIESIRISDKLFNIFSEGSYANSAIFNTDRLLRKEHKSDLLRLLEWYFELEAYWSLSKAHMALNLHFPEFSQAGENILIENVQHPLMKVSQPNTLALDRENVVILTGANMSGTSTFIKSIGLTFYMAYLGVGCRANIARIPLFEKIISCINIKDDLEEGNSYFAAEVKRVSEIMESVQSGKRVLVLCDELFKGTNMDDSIECNMLILHKMKLHKECLFLFSTHFSGVAGAFTEEPGVKLVKFEAGNVNGTLKFTYILEDGISYQRTGVEILKSRISF